MDNQKLNTERLIASFKNTSSNWVTVYESEDKDVWNYYFDLTGNLNDLYFHVVISNHTSSGFDKVRVYNTTDCKEEIEALLIKFNLV